MPVPSTLRELQPEEARVATQNEAALVDLRPVEDFLAGHVHASLSLAYEQGPGLPGRARDCLPLHLPLLLVDDGTGDPAHAAASLRGKGFEVVGVVARSALGNDWEHTTCDVTRGAEPPAGYLLDVNDPGASPVREVDAHIPIDQLWAEANTLSSKKQVCVVAGKGVRAALAVGMLERAGVKRVSFWFSRG